MGDGRWVDVAAAAQQGPPDADREGACARAVARRRLAEPLPPGR
jgi:hypothetical protein